MVRTVTRSFGTLVLLVLFGEAWAESESTLSLARSAWLRGDQESAATYYREIDLAQPAWPDKLEDGIRWQITQGQPLEAWRLSQLAGRVTTIDHLDYYLALTGALAGACVLSHPVARNEWRALLHAHVYRYPNRFRSAGYRAEPYVAAERGVRENHYGVNQRPFLADLSQTKVLRGRGCRLYRSRLVSTNEALKFEWQALRVWYEAYKSSSDAARLPGFEHVLTRLLSLSSILEEDELAQEIARLFASQPAEAWLAIGESERRYLWQRLIEYELVQAPPIKEGDPLAAKLISIVEGISEKDALYWFGQFEFASMSGSLRGRLLDHLLTIDGIEHRDYLLAARAYQYFESGEAKEALATIRLLLVQGAAQGRADIEEFATKMAISIYTEYSYDAVMLGAVQSSLPRRRWAELFRQVTIEHSLAGNLRGLAQLNSIVRANHDHLSLRLDEDMRGLLDGLARRQLSRMQPILERWQNERLTMSRLNFISELAARLFGFDQETLTSIQPQLIAISKVLVYQLSHKRQHHSERLEELIHLFDQSSTSDWAKGSATVRRPTVQVGAADLTNLPHLTWPFSWQAPSTLALRPLLVMPRDIVDREWVIQ